jgi:hypothetical protein
MFACFQEGEKKKELLYVPNNAFFISETQAKELGVCVCVWQGVRVSIPLRTRNLLPTGHVWVGNDPDHQIREGSDTHLRYYSG